MTTSAALLAARAGLAQRAVCTLPRPDGTGV